MEFIIILGKERVNQIMPDLLDTQSTGEKLRAQAEHI